MPQLPQNDRERVDWIADLEYEEELAAWQQKSESTGNCEIVIVESELPRFEPEHRGIRPDPGHRKQKNK